MWYFVEGNVIGLFNGWGAWGIILYNVSDCEYIRSRYWAQEITFSSVTMPPMVTLQDIGGINDFVNQFVGNWFGIRALVNQCHHLHSWIWSKICVDANCCNKLKSLILVS